MIVSSMSQDHDELHALKTTMPLPFQTLACVCSCVLPETTPTPGKNGGRSSARKKPGTLHISSLNILETHQIRERYEPMRLKAHTQEMPSSKTDLRR